MLSLQFIHLASYAEKVPVLVTDESRMQSLGARQLRS